MRILIFIVVQLLVSGYALLRGGRPERAVAIAMLAATVATGLISPYRSPDFTHVVVALLMVDVVFLAAVTAVALLADRYWPMWLAALQLNAVAIHGVRVYDPELVPYAYAWAAAKAAYLMLAILVVGVWSREERRRTAGVEADWTYRRHRRESAAAAAAAAADAVSGARLSSDGSGPS